MRKPLSEITNAECMKIGNKKKTTERDEVLGYLEDVSNRTEDYNLKYDLSKCIETLKGKENQDFRDLKESLEDLMVENEQLFREKAELVYENDLLKNELRGRK